LLHFVQTFSQILALNAPVCQEFSPCLDASLVTAFIYPLSKGSHVVLSCARWIMLTTS